MVKACAEKDSQKRKINTIIFTSNNVALLTRPCSQFPNLPMGPFLTSETPWETGVCFVLTFGSILQITKHLMVEIHYNFHFSKIANHRMV